MTRAATARATLLALVAASALAVAAGCGGSDGVSEAVSPGAAIAAAATKTSDVGSARIAYAATISSPSFGSLEMTGDGVFDYEASRGRITYELGSPVNARMQLIVDELVMYMRLPPELGPPLPRGKSWLRMDLRRVGESYGLDLDALMQPDQADPSQALNYLRGVSEDVEEVGREEVRGVDTTRYRTTVDLERALEESLEELPKDAHAGLRAAIERMIEETGTRTVPMDVWVDDEGLARRLEMTTEMTAREQPGEQVRMEMQVDFFDFGVLVDVQPPAASEVLDVTEFATAQNGARR